MARPPRLRNPQAGHEDSRGACQLPGSRFTGHAQNEEIKFYKEPNAGNLTTMMARPRQIWMPAAALTGFAACFVLAADSPADPLLKLRSEWRQQVEKETRELRKQYSARLEQLEKELAGRGEYAAATRARQERKLINPVAAVETTAPTVPAVVPEGQPLVLEVSAATLSGGVVYDATLGVLRDWKAAGAAARWLLPPGLKTGGYEVELTWSCPPDAGGDLLLKEDFYTLHSAVKPSTGWDDFHTEIIGTLRLLASSRILELSSAAVKGAGLLHLKSIRLLPAAGTK
jgi:hypothetical protein